MHISPILMLALDFNEIRILDMFVLLLVVVVVVHISPILMLAQILDFNQKRFFPEFKI